MSLFRAFILNWVTNANDPLEKHLEELGENADIEVSLLKFDAQKPKAAIIMPLVHPGPFKNIGSSLSTLTSQAWLRKRIQLQRMYTVGHFGA